MFILSFTEDCHNWNCSHFTNAFYWTLNCILCILFMPNIVHYCLYICTCESLIMNVVVVLVVAVVAVVPLVY